MYCTDRNSDDFLNKCQPQDDYLYFAQVSAMKTIKGFGFTPFYDFVKSGDSATTLSQVFSHSSRELKVEYEKNGLAGFLAVHHHEDPEADLSAQFAYEKRLKEQAQENENVHRLRVNFARFVDAYVVPLLDNLFDKIGERFGNKLQSLTFLVGAGR